MLFLIHARVCIKNSTNTLIHFIRPGLEILKSSIYSGEQEKKPATRIFYSRVHSNCCFFSMKWHIPTSLKSHAKSICQEAGSRNVKNPYKSCLLAPFLTHHHSSSSILFLNFPPYYYSCRKQFINRGHRYLPLYFICFDICTIYNVTKP